jgi:hypothetical protein
VSAADDDDVAGLGHRAESRKGRALRGVGRALVRRCR